MVILRPRLLVQATVGLAIAAVAVLGSGVLGPDPVAGSPGQAPAPRILGAALALQPATAVPNQAIIVSGSEFTTASTPGGAGPAGVHQITGTGNSLITLSGIPLGAPQVTYPINLDSAGTLVASVFVPVTLTTLTAGDLTLTVVDDQGVTATVTLVIPQRTLTLTPSTSRRSTTVIATGAGFPAGNPNGPGTFPVSLDYAGASLGNVTPDSSGSFTTTFTVPISALIPSTNTVTAIVVDQPASSTAIHSVPAATIDLVPATGSIGSIVTVNGTNFPPSVPVSSLSIGLVQVLPASAPNSDAVGSFSVSFTVPSLPAGDATIIAGAGGVTAVIEFTVLDPVQLPAPTSTPTPPPSLSVTPAVALEPLLVIDYLLRVWNFDNGTKTWTYYDPRPAFKNANTITEMRSGRIYWVSIVSDRAVILNGKKRSLNSGWNLLAW